MITTQSPQPSPAIPAAPSAAAARTSAAKPVWLAVPAKLFAFFASFRLAVVVLAFMLLVTWLGTLAQTSAGIYDVQKKFFSSFFFTEEVGPIRLPLPGGYLLMSVLSLNILCGGLVRIRKNWRNVGVIIAHFSILLLLVAAGVSHRWKHEGYTRLFEAENSNVFTSFDKRVIEIGEDGRKAPLLQIREEEFNDCSGEKGRAFFSKSLPFEITVSGYHRNCQAESAAMRPAQHGETVIDGYYLKEAKIEKEAEANFAGVQVALMEPGGKEPKPGLLWELATAPLTFRTGDGRAFTLKLVHETWEMPFTITLNKFTHELHPGTRHDKVFESEITKREDGLDEAMKIEMNKPLRRGGYTVFQQGWGPKNWTPEMGRDQLYSVFAVVKNPSDRWPVYACIMAAVGLAIHFIMKLVGAITRAQRKGAIA